MGKKCEECKPGLPLWMGTFADMATLLMTFFILLLSMASMDKRKIKVALGSLQGSLGVLKEGNKTEMSQEDILSRLSFVQNVRSVQRKVSQSLKEYVKSAQMSQVVTIAQTKKGVSVRILDKMLFQPGSAELLDQAKPLLDKLAAVIEESPFNIMVEGHTDDIPISTAIYPSNWELSTARAVAVVKYFLSKQVSAQKLSAAGYAENHPVTPNISEASRAKNRRVEVNFVSPEFAEANKQLFDDEDTGEE
ncbi:MAG: flagellar motor protein MotB [Denitrovibrio sp.]|nr:MAG: flagellar motor protein MotB [Denitrovibrio sp.]